MGCDIQIIIGSPERHITIQATALAADARQTVRDSNHVTDLASVAAAALVELAVEEQAGADASAKKEIDETGQAAPHAVKPLPDCRCGRVVFDKDRHTETVRKLARHGKVLPVGQRYRTK